jgi:hypothetical protein
LSFGINELQSKYTPASVKRNAQKNVKKGRVAGCRRAADAEIPGKIRVIKAVAGLRGAPRTGLQIRAI